MMKRVLMVTAAAASVAACSSMGMGRMGGAAQGGMGHTMPDGSTMSAPMAGTPMMPTQAMAYIRAAGEGDLYEVTSSQIALQRTQNPDIRAFATKLIDHHTMTTNATLAAAKAGRVAPPPAVLGPRKRAMIEQLNARTGMAFDRLYVQQQVPAHEEALALHTNYARAGDVATLRASAAGAVPVVTGHLNEARAMQTRMGGM